MKFGTTSSEKRIEDLAVSDADIEVVQMRVYGMLVRNDMIPSNDFQELETVR